MHMMSDPEGPDQRWKGLYKTGAFAALAMLVIMLAQIVIFIVWPPPETVDGFFTLFQQNWLLGLLSVDLLYILNNTLLILIYLALYAALKRSAKSAMLVALVLGLVGITAYYASNTAFEMLSLSQQFAGARDETQRTILRAAGQTMLAIYQGTAFDVYYVLNGITLLIISFVMLRSSLFSRTTAITGIISGFLMSIPSTAGMVGLFFSLASLVPWAVFSVLVARRLLQISAIRPNAG